jgi:hypothetical protein
VPTAALARGGPGGAGGGAASPTPAPSACQPLPGTCVLTAQMVSVTSNKPLGLIQFERSPQRMDVTTTINVPGAGPPPQIISDVVQTHREYTGILVSPFLVNEPGIGQAYRGYAGRGLFDTHGSLVLESLPGDGLFSHTPNYLPEDPAILAYRIAGLSLLEPPGQLPAAIAVAEANPAYPTIQTPPTADVLAAFEGTHAGSTAYLITVVEQAADHAGIIPASTGVTFVAARGTFQ